LSEAGQEVAGSPEKPERSLIPERWQLVLTLLLGAFGWLVLAWTAHDLLALVPSRLGDDLQLLLAAAGRSRAGVALYPAIGAGTSLSAAALFYSYPPVVAQILAPLAGLPLAAVLGVGAVLALGGFLAVVRAFGAPDRYFVLMTAAGLPFVSPLAVALLFGNLDAWFPLVFGLGILALYRPDRRIAVIAGVALGVAVVCKLYPATIGLWWLVYWSRRGRHGSTGTLLAAALLTGGALLGLSLLAGGLAPWEAYISFLRASAAGAVNFVDPLNLGPASQAALWLGFGAQSAGMLQVLIAAGAIVITLLAASRCRDPLEGLAWAVTASLVVLPLTWFHYPVVLLPFVLAALARRNQSPRPGLVIRLAVVAFAVAAAGLDASILVWVAVAFALAAVRTSRPSAVTVSPLTGPGSDRSALAAS
jgi:hypothetical protein